MSNRRSEIVDEIDFALQQSEYVTTYTVGISDYRKAARQIVEVLENLGVFDVPKPNSDVQPQLPQADVISNGKHVPCPECGDFGWIDTDDHGGRKVCPCHY